MVSGTCEICKQPRVARTSKVNSEISSRRIFLGFWYVNIYDVTCLFWKNQLYNIFSTLRQYFHQCSWTMCAMQQRLHMPTRTQRAGRAAAARLWQRLPVSDGEPMLLMTETKKFPRPQMVRSVSAYWLAIRERRFSTKSGSIWKILARTGI